MHLPEAHFLGGQQPMLTVDEFENVYLGPCDEGLGKPPEVANLYNVALVLLQRHPIGVVGVGYEPVQRHHLDVRRKPPIFGMAGPGRCSARGPAGAVVTSVNPFANVLGMPSSLVICLVVNRARGLPMRRSTGVVERACVPPSPFLLVR